MLDGLLVLDLSRVLAGPYCTQLLADLGARVVKVEGPGGDDTRGWGPPFAGDASGYFLSVNRGKESVALDLKHAEGARLARALAARADVVVENFKVGDLSRYGLDYASVAAANPGCVYASITGFGRTGPRAHESGYDAALQAMTGVMAMTGEEGGGPVKLGVAWVDVLTGLHAAVGILAALRERDRSTNVFNARARHHRSSGRLYATGQDLPLHSAAGRHPAHRRCLPAARTRQAGRVRTDPPRPRQQSRQARLGHGQVQGRAPPRPRHRQVRARAHYR